MESPFYFSYQDNVSDCEVVIFDITRGGHTEANFGKHSIMFPKNYQGVEEGTTTVK